MFLLAHVQLKRQLKVENNLLTLKNVTHEVVDNTLVISITKGAQFNSFIHVDDIIESTSKVKIICKENSFVKLLVEKYVKIKNLQML